MEEAHCLKITFYALKIILDKKLQNETFSSNIQTICWGRGTRPRHETSDMTDFFLLIRLFFPDDVISIAYLSTQA